MRWWQRLSVLVGTLFLLLCLGFAQDWRIADTQTIAPGVFYQALQRSQPPTWVGVVRLPLPLPPQMMLTTALGGNQGFDRQPLSRIATFVQQRKGYVTAAINGDYFAMTLSPYSGDPLGLHIQDGELVSLPWVNRSALVGLKDGQVLIARFQFEAFVRFPDGNLVKLDGLNQQPPKEGLCLFTPAFGAKTRTPEGTVEVIASADLPLRPNNPLTLTVQQVTETGDASIPADGVVLVGMGQSAELLRQRQPGETLQVVITLTPLDAVFDPQQIQWAISGGPRLLRGGQVSIEWQQEGMSLSFVQTKHPRTAVGLKEDALFWVVVDGRQPGYAEGMSLEELAELLRNMGCKEALNLDGGGSSTLFVRGQVLNRPSDGRERPIANALMLLNLFPPQPLLRLLVTSNLEGHWLMGTPLPLQIVGEDAAYRFVPVSPEEVSLDFSPPLNGWQWDGQQLWLPPLEGEEPVSVRLTISARNGTAAPAIVTFCVHPRPTELNLQPNPLAIAPNAQALLKLEVLGRERDGQLVPLRFNPQAVQWQVDEALGKVYDGQFVAASTTEPKRGTLYATLNGVTTSVPVCVGEMRWLLLHEFDNMDGLQLVGYPETTKVDGQITTQRQSGTGALLLRYDFSQGGKTRTASVVLNKPLPSGACRIKVLVYGDGSGCWLRARLRDAAGKLVFIDLASTINWRQQWRELVASLPSGLTEPVVLEAIYLAVIRDEQRCAGTVVFDQLQVGVSGM